MLSRKQVEYIQHVLTQRDARCIVWVAAAHSTPTERSRMLAERTEIADIKLELERLEEFRDIVAEIIEDNPTQQTGGPDGPA